VYAAERIGTLGSEILREESKSAQVSECQKVGGVSAGYLCAGWNFVW
jgi:hypothetical protein